MKRQRGFSFGGLMIGAVIFGFIVLIGLKAAPEWMEYGKIVKAIKLTAADPALREGTVTQVRQAYQKKMEIDDIKSVKPEELEITKDGSDLVISFAYEKKIKLFSNVSLVFDFEGASNKQ